MAEEKIIQIAFDKNDINPVVLTNEGRILSVKFNGTYSKVVDDIDVPNYEWKDITPDLNKIKKNI